MGVVVVALRRRERSLAGQFLLLQLVVVALLLVIVGLISFRQSTVTFSEERGSRLRALAETLVNTPPIRVPMRELGEGQATREAARLDLAPSVQGFPARNGVDDVLVLDPQGRVVAASDPTSIDVPAELGGSRALEGRAWVGDVDLDGERTLAAYAPILSNDAEFRGVVVVEQAYPSIWDRVTGSAADLVLYLGLGALLGGLGTYVVSRVVKRRTQGLRATEIANLADQRAALLHAIREGVVAVDTDGRVTMINDAARAVLGLDGEPPVGRPVEGLGLPGPVVDLLIGADGEVVRDAVALVGDRVVVLNRQPAQAQGRGIGSVTTVRDRTELVSLQSQLSSNLSITDTLRAQTHEFDNRLHTISGLVQLGEYDEVSALIGTLTRRRAEVADAVSARVHDPAVAALLVAKQAVAEERGVELELDPGSLLPRLGPELSADLTTVLGNLIDNAVDASAARADALVEVWLTVDESAAPPTLHVRVRDNGPGVPAALRDRVFERGVSTKDAVPGGRGIGLPLVRLVCAQRGGAVTVDEALGGGAEFRISLPLGELTGAAS